VAHREQQYFIQMVKERFPTFFVDQRVLEIGSLDINGSVRSFFSGGAYTGIDVGPGPGVDIVCEGQNYPAPDGSFDVVISCECMEHNPYWAETWNNMIRMCRSGGLVVMTCATTGRAEHGTTRTSPQDSPLTVGKGWNYYKNLVAEDFTQSADMPSLFREMAFSTNTRSKDLYFWGVRA
jgi:SAM-dependent methyltransferase